MKLDLDALHPDAEIAKARRELAARWRAEGLHDDETLPAAMARAAREDPEVTIVLHSEQHPGRLTLAALERRARAVADALSQRGIAEGDVVAIQLPNWEEAAIATIAVAMLGAISIPIVHIYGPKETDWILRASGARMLMCPDRWGKIDYLDRIARMPAAAEIQIVIVGSELPDGAIAWDVLEAQGDSAVDPPQLDAGAPLLILFTSGTTADPKGVIHTHQTLMAELRNMPQAPANQPERVSLMPWPAGHIGGLCALLAPIVTRARCILIDQWDPAEAARLIEKHRVDTFCGAPIHVAAMLDLLDRCGRRPTMTGASSAPLSILLHD